MPGTSRLQKRWVFSLVGILVILFLLNPVSCIGKGALFSCCIKGSHRICLQTDEVLLIAAGIRWREVLSSGGSFLEACSRSTGGSSDVRGSARARKSEAIATSLAALRLLLVQFYRLSFVRYTVLHQVFFSAAPWLPADEQDRCHACPGGIKPNRTASTLLSRGNDAALTLTTNQGLYSMF